MRLTLFSLAIAAVLTTTACKKTDVGSSTPTLTSLTCSSATISANATASKAYTATATVPYMGGNGLAYLAGTAIPSTGVSGLTATLSAGTLATGAGNLTYNVSGTPASAGVASFAISFGDQACSINLTVNAKTASISALTCASVTYSATATASTAYTATATVPYTGGNGVTYNAGTAIASTGITGLTATLSGGTLASGTGNLSYAISGNPSASGTASFAISFGTQNCSISLPVAAKTSSSTIPSVFSGNFKSAVTLSISSDGATLTAKSAGIPDHKTPYWETSNALWEAQTTGQTVNPGTLQSQNFVMSIPVSPLAATTKEETSLGPIGMALNGVAIYNDREGGNVPVDAGTLKSFDRAGAHSGPGGLYHYHFNGDFTSKDDAKLIGWLRDGFPIYGRKCSSTGTYATGLDSNGGHTSATTEYASGIYHYHCSNVNYMTSGFYVLKAGSYNGKKGTFTF